MAIIFLRARMGKILPLLLYAGLLFLAIPQSLSIPIYLAFFAYSLFIFWIVWPNAYTQQAQPQEQNTKKYHKFFLYLLIFSWLFLIITRLMPFIRYGEAPLGYDTGFYRDYIRFSKYTDFISSGQELNTRPSTVTLHWNPLYTVLRIPWLTLLQAEYILLQFLIAGSLYTLARTLSRSSRLPHASVLLFLFTTSLVQFFAFWWMFFQQALSLAFLLITLALIYRRSFLAIITGALGAAIHFPTFLPLGAALIMYTIFQIIKALIHKKRPDTQTTFIITAGILMLGLSLILRDGLWFIRYLVSHGWLQAQYPTYQIGEAAGLFIDPKLFYLSVIYVLPLAILGTLLFIFRIIQSRERALTPRLLLLFLLALVLLVLTSYPFIYQHRFLILLDIAFILFAAYPFRILLQSLLTSRAGQTMIVLIMVGFILNSSLIVWNQEPQLYSDELQEIKALQNVPETDAYAMSISGVYSPWVFTFSERPTIAPGLFGWDRWNLSMWKEFWNGPSNARRHELLNLYDAPLYIFIGRKLDSTMLFQKFIRSDSHFSQISPHVWRYNPRVVSKEEIEQMLQQERISNNSGLVPPYTNTP